MPPFGDAAGPAACPNCGVLLDPAPARDRLCPRCRRRIVVRHTEGRRVLLSETSVAVFEAERQRAASRRTWEVERGSWLELARSAGAPPARLARLADAPVTEAVVASTRALYEQAAERASRAARRERRWADLARIRREQAAARHRALGHAVPPPNDVLALYREGIEAKLRSLAGYAREAELVGAGCCPACRRDDGRAFAIAAEIRGARLPHPGCPRGLCACDWWPLPVVAKPGRGARRRTSGAAARQGAGHSPHAGTEPGAEGAGHSPHAGTEPGAEA